MAKKLLSTAEVAALTGLKPKTLANWRSQNKGPPYVKVSAYLVRYPEDRLAKWIDSRLIVPNGRRRA